nr:glutamate receptor 1.2-like [Ipomoea batatas]
MTDSSDSVSEDHGHNEHSEVNEEPTHTQLPDDVANNSGASQNHLVFGEYIVIVKDDRSVMEDNIAVGGGGSYEAMAGLDFYEFKKRRYDHASFRRHVGDFYEHGHLLPLAFTAEDESSEFEALPRYFNSCRIPMEEYFAYPFSVSIVNTRFNQFVALEHESETGAIMNVSGFSVDVFRAAMRLIEYKLECEFVLFVVTNSSGQTAGSYTDLLKELHLGHLDAVVGDTTITSDRLSLVDFTLPYTDPGVGTVARLQQRQGMWFFLKPMVAQLWILFIVSCVCVGAIVWLIEHQTNEQFQGSIAQQIGTALWFAFSSLFYAHRENLQSNLSRFVVSVWLFIVFIMSSAFTARLSSSLTAQEIQSPMDDYMGSQRGSSIHGSVVNNINFHDNRLKHYNSPEEYREALSKGSKNGGADAIVDEIPYLKAFLARYPSQYAITGAETNTGGFGFAFRKGSPLAPEFSRAITKLREEGRLKQLEKKWFTNNHQSSEGGFNFYDFRGLFVLSVIANAIFLSMFLFFFIRKKLRENCFILQVLSMRYMRRMIRYMFFRNINVIHDVEMR